MREGPSPPAQHATCVAVTSIAVADVNGHRLAASLPLSAAANWPRSEISFPIGGSEQGCLAWSSSRLHVPSWFVREICSRTCCPKNGNIRKESIVGRAATVDWEHIIYDWKKCSAGAPALLLDLPSVSSMSATTYI